MDKQITYQGIRVSYRLEGSGQPVVLLHGFGEDSRIWDQQVPALKEHCCVITPDIPGSGRSGMLVTGTAGEVSISDYAEAIRAILDAEGLQNCIMLGHSMGGYITLAFAEKYPQMLTAYGLVNSTAFADGEEKKSVRARAIETIGQYGAAAFIRTTIPNLFAPRFREAHPEKLEALIEAGKQFSEAALQQYYRSMMNRPDRTHVLQSNRLPVLFVTGTDDAAAPMNDVLRQVSLPDKSYIHVLDNVGHMSMWEAADALNEHLLSFIKQE